MIVAITGHRPRQTDGEEKVRRRFRNCFSQMVPDKVIYGGADGTDLWAASEAHNIGIPLTFAKPWDTHRDTITDKALYDALEAACEHVEIISDTRGQQRGWYFQRRNEWMVDHATHLLAFWNGKPSGTKNTWDYADGKIKRRNLYDWPPY